MRGAVALKGVAQRWMPRPARRLAARVYAEVVSADVRATLRRLIRSNRPVIAGPWLGEVGFELLYWVPFLRWVVESEGLEPKRVTVVSRGGVESWYQGLGARYRDVFDHLSPNEFRRCNEQRRRELGEQKQVRMTTFDHELVDRIRLELREPHLEVLHPSLMYRLMQPYWWQHVRTAWVSRHTRFAPLTGQAPDRFDLELPESYVAVKFYYNDCFTSTSQNRAFVTSMMSRLAEEGPIVSLSTALEIDDHGSYPYIHHRDLSGHVVMTPRNNLAVQTAVVTGARAFVGTYGGFAYLAPFLGVPATAVWSERDRFDPRHLELIQRVLPRMNGARLCVTATDEAVTACGGVKGNA